MPGSRLLSGALVAFALSLTGSSGVAHAGSAPTDAAAPARKDAQNDADGATTRPRGRAFRHDGINFDLGVGAFGCINDRTCGTAYAADHKPGFEVHGFAGYNLAGVFEPGVRWSWGTFGSTFPTGVTLDRAIDPSLLSVLQPHAGRIIDASARVVELGPLVRVHLAPWSRILAYVGSGVTYTRWRQIYATSEGEARLDYHTLSVPLQAALGYYITRHIAVGFEFTYRWTWHGNVIARYRPSADLEVFTERGSHALVSFGELWMMGVVGRVRF